MTNNSDYGSTGEVGAQVVVVDGEKKRSNEEYGVTSSDNFYDDHESDIIALFDVDYTRERSGVFETNVAVTSSGVRKDYSKFLFGSILRSSDKMPFGEINSISTQRGCVETCCSCSSAHSVVVESIEGDVAHLLPTILEADTLVNIAVKKISNLPVEAKVEVPEDSEKEVV